MNQLLAAMKKRRSFYALSKESPVSDESIVEIVKSSTKHIPTPYNMQNLATVLLLGEEHTALWEIVSEELKERIGPERFEKTGKKIETSFASGYGTVLYFHDTKTTQRYADESPRYADKYKEWTLHSAGMLQFAVWTLLVDAGFGVSLQHYNPLIDERVAKRWDIPEGWELLSQMPFGVPVSQPGTKEFRDINEHFMMFPPK